MRLTEFADLKAYTLPQTMWQFSSNNFSVYGPIARLMILRHTSRAKEISRRSSPSISSTRYERKSKASVLVVISATAIDAFTISQGSDRQRRRIPSNFAATT
jgi:hypothetical protein